MTAPSRVQLFSICFLALTASYDARAQCYQFTSGNNASLTVTITNLPAPTVSTDGQGDTTWNYDLTGLTGNSVTVTVGGANASATSFPGGPNPAFIIRVISGPGKSYFFLEVGTPSSTVNGLLAVVQLGVTNETTPQAPPNGFFTNGLPATLPPLSVWGVEAGATPVIETEVLPPRSLPTAFAGNLTAIGSACSCLTSQTVVSVPGQPDSRTTVGVGEVVQLNASSQAKWSIAGTGFLNEPMDGVCTLATSTTSVTGPKACFTAPYLGASSTVTAEMEGNPSCPITFNTIEPSGLIFQRLDNPGFAYKDKTNLNVLKPGIFIGMWTAAFLLPGNVSFANIGIAEQDQDEDKDNYIVRPYVPPVLVRGIDPTNPNTTGWLVGCDQDALALTLVEIEPHTWVYTWGSDDYVTAKKKQFATVDTQLTFPLFVWLLQKGQVTPSLAGKYAAHFIEPPANLLVPVSTPKTTIGRLPGNACLVDITAQFGLVQ